MEFKNSNNYTPIEIEEYLNKFIIGQHEAKQAIAVAFRNAWRRMQLSHDLRQEVQKPNILMIGSTGIGKTEIARRLATLAEAPFIKVEATKFTEVGYIGKDVEQIIKDLLEISINLVKKQKSEFVKTKAHNKVEKIILEALISKESAPKTIEKFREKLRNGELEDYEIEIQILEQKKPNIDLDGGGHQVSMLNLNDIFGNTFSSKNTKRAKIKDARGMLMKDEINKLLNEDDLQSEAITLVENYGVVFLDEIDKICGKTNNRGGDVSREGVQRDLLPLIEGTVISTKYGQVKTDHILFICSGAFHLARPSDLLPELQGRLPIKVNLNKLTKEDFIKILKNTKYNLIIQYTELLKVDGVDLEFTDCGIEYIADIAEKSNDLNDDIGARRLHAIFEKILRDTLYRAPNKDLKKLIINADFVKTKIQIDIKHNNISSIL